MEKILNSVHKVSQGVTNTQETDKNVPMCHESSDKTCKYFYSYIKLVKCDPDPIKF